MQNKKCLKEIIPILRHTYKSIDIRALAAQPKNKNEWKCIFLKIRLTYTNELKIEEIYKNKSIQLGIESKERFQLLGECKNINKLDHIIEEIQKGEITVKGDMLKLDNMKAKNILDLPIQTYQQYSTAEERSGYNHWFVFTTHDLGNSTCKVITDLELNEEDLGIEFDMINQWFDISSDEWEKNTNNFVLLLPIYIKRIGISKSGTEEILIKYNIHKHLLKECTGYIIDSPKIGFPTKTILPSNKLLEFSQNSEETELKILPITIRFISQEETVKFKLVHNTSNKLFSDILEYKDVKLLVNKSLSKKSQVNYLQRLILETAQTLGYHSPRSQVSVDPVELYLYHLLSPLFPCIWIGLFENINQWKLIFEKEGFTNLIDFILFDKNSIMLIECTRQFLGGRSIVGEYETVKLTHVKAILEKRGYRVYALLFCLEPYTNNPHLFNKILHQYGNQVYFMFKEDLEEIESNIYTITKHEDILKYSRNYKVGSLEDI